jgi:hypothetical protein
LAFYVVTKMRRFKAQELYSSMPETT